MKSVQIPYDLFIDLAMYHLRGDDDFEEEIRQGLEQKPEITLNGWTLTPAETPILTEPMEQYQMAGTKGYVLVLPDEVASQLSGE